MQRTIVRDNVRVSGWVAVLVDNKELVPFSRLREGASGSLNLTTMLPDQDRASVEVHLVNGSESARTHTFQTENLRREGRRPDIVISARVQGKLHVSLRVEGELVGSEAFAIPATMTAFRRGPLIAILLALLAVLGLGWGVWWAFSNIDAPAPRERVAEIVVLEDAGEARTVSPAEREPLVDPPAATAEPAPPAAEPPATELEVTVLFEPERADLLPPATEALDRIAAALQRWESAGADPESMRVELVGHTALYGNERSRVALSDERARAAAGYLRERLRELGIADVEISVAGRGGREPVTRAEPEQWRNRRVEIDVTTGDP